jgi:hypothetical protein
MKRVAVAEGRARVDAEAEIGHDPRVAVPVTAEAPHVIDGGGAPLERVEER